MEDGIINKPNLIDLEALRSKLLEKIYISDSTAIKLTLYFEYLQNILQYKNSNIEEAFLKEFLEDFISTIKKYEVSGNDPSITKKVFNELEKIKDITAAAEIRSDVIIEIARIEDQWIRQTKILNGEEASDLDGHKAYFPLIDNNTPYEFYGIIESATIRINKATEDDKFIIVPSEKEIEKRIVEQCRISWYLALSLSKKYVKKTFKHHEVIISFDKKIGFYEGNSLGISLTLSFLDEILKFYNPTYIINIVEKCAFTGGLNENGEILNTGDEIIKRKVAAIFISEINSFVIPKLDESYAYFALTQLKREYPNRKLKLIAVEEINDVINRRDLIDVKKQKVVVRSAKFIKKNWISAVVTVLLAISFAYLFVMDFDDNPALLQSDGSNLFVKNKKGKVLWTKRIDLGGVEILNTELSTTARIIDIDGDRVNEVLLTQKFDDKTLKLKDYSSVYCYDKKGKTIWIYEFKDSVISNREELKPDYTVKIVDTLTLYSNANILLISKNVTSYTSAIFRINLRTGKRLRGTVWTAGHIMEGEIKDIDKDGKKEFIGTGYENGYEDVTFWGVEIDSLLKMRPTREDYFLRNMNAAEMKVYIRFPKIDYDYYKQIRTPTLISNNFSDNQRQREYRFSIGENTQVQTPNLSYKIDYNFKDIDVIITSGFRVRRDSLVAQGKLDLPFTDTDAYKKIIIDNILYWNNGEWVKRNELD